MRSFASVPLLTTTEEGETERWIAGTGFVAGRRSRRGLAAAVVLALSAALAPLVALPVRDVAAAAVATGTWQPNPTSLRTHSDAAIAYDAARHRIVLFGGWSDGAVRNETWEWDGTTWARRTPTTSPAPRTNHSMAYDAARQRVVLFGGTTSSDTWEWDGTNWTRRTPATSPPARSNAAMAYDAGRQRIVLFGGIDRVGLGHGLADTWEWDGTTWTERMSATSPPGRQGHAMAYDAARQRVVVFGGMTWGAKPGDLTIVGDTWEWDGEAWAKRAPPASPSPRMDAAMAYDIARHRVVLFGGNADAAVTNDLWDWDGSTWVRRTTVTAPAARTGAAMATDIARASVVLYGGRSPSRNLGDTWEWDGTGWIQRASPPLDLNGVVLDKWGGLHPWTTPGPWPPSDPNDGVPDGVPATGDRRDGGDRIRGLASLDTGGTGDLELDPYGGIHAIQTSEFEPPRPSGGPSWPGWDIARGIAVMPDGSGGLVLDGWGGLHPFSLDGRRAPSVNPRTGPYWYGWDIARAVVINQDGRGGYVLDGWGGLHPFGINGNPAPVKRINGPYWYGWDIARGAVSVPAACDCNSGYIVDGWGGIHGYSDGAPPAKTNVGPYWPGQDVARGILFTGRPANGLFTYTWSVVGPPGGTQLLVDSAVACPAPAGTLNPRVRASVRFTAIRPDQVAVSVLQDVDSIVAAHGTWRLRIAEPAAVAATAQPVTGLISDVHCDAGASGTPRFGTYTNQSFRMP